LTEVAPSGLQRLGCNKATQLYYGIEFTSIIHHFGKKQKSVQNLGRRRAPPAAGRGRKFVVYKLAVVLIKIRTYFQENPDADPEV